ncbi:MAG: hypothetical protein SFU56_05660 [Capsulimonadales bacterium]|nr:hypothetical protein [Capsulimonadales bacterium]
MSNFELFLASRPERRESIDEKHARFITALTQLEDPWRLDPAKVRPLPKSDRWPSVGQNLSAGLAKGFRANVLYHSRLDLKDQARYDDIFWYNFRQSQVEFSQLVLEVFPTLLVAFNGYYGYIGDKRVFLDTDNNRRVDSRFGIDRIHQVVFCDEILCQRFFNRSVSEILKILRDTDFLADVVHTGCRIAMSLAPIDLEQEKKIDERLMRILRPG